MCSVSMKSGEGGIVVDTYCAIDLKSYYASVECVYRGLDPLTAYLLVADETRSDSTICLAVSPALKAIGVPSRPRLFEAKENIRLAEAALHRKISYIIAMPRMAEYERISAQIYSVYLRYVSVEDIHVYSIDECFIDVTHYLHLYKARAKRAGMTPAHFMVLTMIRDVLRETGITATAGIGTNLYLAKVAMDIVAKKAPADKDGVRIADLDEEAYKRELWTHRPLIDFWRVGHGMRDRLEKYGIRTMGDIARVSLVDEELLYKLFGKDAEILIDHAWGIDPCTMKEIKEYKPRANSLSVGQVLPRPYSYAEARIIMVEMIDQLTLDMVDKEMATDRISIWIGFDPVSLDRCSYDGPLAVDYYGRLHPRHAGGTARLPTRTANAKAITEAVLAVFDRAVNHSLYIRRLGIAADDVTNANTQLHMFTDYQRERKELAIRKAVLGVKKKYGNNALIKGINLLECGTARERNRQIGGHRA